MSRPYRAEEVAFGTGFPSHATTLGPGLCGGSRVRLSTYPQDWPTV